MLYFQLQLLFLWWIFLTWGDDPLIMTRNTFVKGRSDLLSDHWPLYDWSPFSFARLNSPQSYSSIFSHNLKYQYFLFGFLTDMQNRHCIGSKGEKSWCNDDDRDLCCGHLTIENSRWGWYGSMLGIPWQYQDNLCHGYQTTNVNEMRMR